MMQARRDREGRGGTCYVSALPCVYLPLRCAPNNIAVSQHLMDEASMTSVVRGVPSRRLGVERDVGEVGGR